MRPNEDELDRLLREMRGLAWTRRLRRSDPRYGDLVGRLSSSARSFAEAMEQVRQIPRHAPERGHAAEALRIAREISRQLPTGALEDEFRTALRFAHLAESGARAVSMRLGWDGYGGTTLEEAGRACDLTRERVRQLEGQLKRKIQSGSVVLPLLDEALELLERASPVRCKAAWSLLHKDGLVRGDFKIEGILKTAQLAGVKTNLKIVEGCLLDQGQDSVRARIVEAARKLVTSNGAGSVESLGELVHELDLSKEQLERFLELNADLDWLDPERSWFFLPTGRNRAENYLRKILSVNASVSIRDLRDGLRRPPEREVRLPAMVLKELCERLDWIEVNHETATSRVQLNYCDVLEHTEQTLVEIFRDHGPVLDRSTAVDLAAERGLDRTTAGLNLGWSPVIQRIVTNRYALRGEDVPAGTLEAMRDASPRRRVQQDFGWTREGRLRISYRLSQAVIDSGVVGAPGALRDELSGRYALAPPNEQLGHINTDGANIWGLPRLLRHYGAEAGDALIVEFDLASRLCCATLGGPELLDREPPADESTEDVREAMSLASPNGAAARSR
jgi:hypothetical protein